MKKEVEKAIELRKAMKDKEFNEMLDKRKCAINEVCYECASLNVKTIEPNFLFLTKKVKCRDCGWTHNID